MDDIQRTLIRAGRKDLAQKYYQKTAAVKNISIPVSIQGKRITIDLDAVRTIVENKFGGEVGRSEMQMGTRNTVIIDL